MWLSAPACDDGLTSKSARCTTRRSIDTLGIRLDLTVDLRVDILRKKDGPTLQHGLIGVQGKTIMVPSRPESRPNPEFLAERYELFRKAG